MNDRQGDEGVSLSPAVPESSKGARGSLKMGERVIEAALFLIEHAEIVRGECLSKGIVVLLCRSLSSFYRLFPVLPMSTN